MNKASIQIIKNQVALVKVYIAADKFDELLNGCRSLLVKINKRIWPKRKVNITLKTAYQPWAHDYTFNDFSEEIDERIADVIRSQNPTN